MFSKICYFEAILIANAHTQTRKQDLGVNFCVFSFAKKKKKKKRKKNEEEEEKEEKKREENKTNKGELFGIILVGARAF